MTTPNMNLTLPVVSTTPGPQWANQINADLALVDAHNHTSGFGARIPTAALNINADLLFNNYSAAQLYSTQFNDLGVASPSIIAGLYVKSGDLYYNNGSAVPVRLTNGSSIVGAGGTIGGLPSAIWPTASVNFVDGTASYVFQQATNQAAAMDVGPVTVRKTTTSSAGVTIKPSTSTTSYDLTLPSAVPAAQSMLSIATTGVVTNATPDSTITVTSSQIKVAALGIQTGNIANGAVTGAKMASVNSAVSSSCGTYSVPGDGLNHAVTNLAVTLLTPTLRPIMVFLEPDGGGSPAYLELDPQLDIFIQASLANTGNFAFTRLKQLSAEMMKYAPSLGGMFIPTNLGNTVFTVYAKNQGGTVNIVNCKLVAYQL